MLTRQDEEHLRLLSILHYAMAGLAALGALIPLVYAAFGGLFLVATGMNRPQTREAEMIAWLVLALSLAVVLVIVSAAFILFLVGRYLSQRRSYTFCFIVSIVQLLFFPLGTLLGIFTIIVLNRETVKATMTSRGLIA